MHHETIEGLFCIAAGALLLWYRDDFADQMIEYQRRTWGLNYDRTWTRRLHVVIGIWFCLIGLAFLFFGPGPPN